MTFFIYSQTNFLNKITKEAEKIMSSDKKVSNKEASDGIMEALISGSKYSVSRASARGGFNNNLLIRIPFPKEASKMKTSLEKIGFSKKIEEFETSINRSAEIATKKALDILINAIKKMTIKDAFSILNGKENAATRYLKEQTSRLLYSEFKPIISSSMEEVKIAQQWNPLVSKYNSIPLTKKINPDLEDYITLKTIDGLFILIAEQEKEIRDNPQARTTELLKKVFK